jgi:hypothetical protein
LSPKMTSNEKGLNYKVVDLVESYNFHINFILIRVHTKKLCFLEKLCLLPRGVTVATANWNGGKSATVPPTAVPGGDRSLPPFTTTVGGYFCNFLDPLYIFEKMWKNKYRVDQSSTKLSSTVITRLHNSDVGTMWQQLLCT